jgi:3-methyladenine DNA glycosylase AlkD
MSAKTAKELEEILRTIGDPHRAVSEARYFKTGPGDYGEGDIFIGLTVPEVRRLSKEYKTFAFKEIVQLLQSPLHSARLLALFILVEIWPKASATHRNEIYHAYLDHARYINNWDLVDMSAPHIVGAYMWDKDRSHLANLAMSDLIWERRIAIMATFYFIKRNQFTDSLKISQLLLNDSHDLIHKAVGWMLREVGKRDQIVEEDFLKLHYKRMPRTMLRYAIEKFPEYLRQQYLKGNVV